MRRPIPSVILALIYLVVSVCLSSTHRHSQDAPLNPPTCSACLWHATANADTPVVSVVVCRTPALVIGQVEGTVTIPSCAPLAAHSRAPPTGRV